MEVERMSFRPLRRAAVAAVAGAAASALILTGCSGSASTDGKTTISFLIDNGATSTDVANAVIADFEAKNPDINVELETRPPGAEGDNVLKTKLSTGEMNDVFLHNSGSNLRAIDPDKTLVNLADETWTSKLDENFKSTVSTDQGLYGVPWGPSSAGAIIYNKDLYAELGLQIPRTWDEFMANSQKILDSGKAAPIAQTYGDTWSSQVLLLGDYFNVQSKDPDWAEKFTTNKAKFADEPALAGFEHYEEALKAGYFNKDYATATYDDGVRMVATGKAAQYPILSFASSALKANYPDAVDKVGMFPIPGEAADKNGLTVWMPNALYIPKSTEGAELEASKKFVEFWTTPEACKTIGEKVAPTGPFVVEGCDLPADVPAMIKDMQPYFDEKKTGLALEFLSPVKGPALEQIVIAVGSGITPAKEGARQYDEDVKKQAQQLGLEGWK
jgi:raffinose/stachyose/melibiose transport system substrate-binding protein